MQRYWKVYHIMVVSLDTLGILWRPRLLVTRAMSSWTSIVSEQLAHVWRVPTDHTMQYRLIGREARLKVTTTKEADWADWIDEWAECPSTHVGESTWYHGAIGSPDNWEMVLPVCSQVFIGSVHGCSDSPFCWIHSPSFRCQADHSVLLTENQIWMYRAKKYDHENASSNFLV